MSSVAPAAEPARTSGLAAIFEHTRYVLGENRVTAFAFGLLIVIVFAALFGPYIVPYDPLASDTVAALKPPSPRTGSAPTSSGATSSAASSWRPGSTPSSRWRRWCWCS